MPITFDLSSLAAAGAGAQAGALSLCQPCAPDFCTGGARDRVGHQRPLLRAPAARAAPPSTGAAGQGGEPCSRGDDDANDQYTIRPGRSYWYSVLFHNNTGHEHRGSLLGRYGHAERLPAWIHLIAGVAFLVYGLARHAWTDPSTASRWVTASVLATSFCFGSSTVYHVTAPGRVLAAWTRQLDFLGIYLAIAVSATADLALATRGFQRSHPLSTLDTGLAAALVCAFFLSRRYMTPIDDTWTTFLGGCTLQFGLFRKLHVDRAHTGTRQSTSFILAIAFFVSVPSSFRMFDAPQAAFLLAVRQRACSLSSSAWHWITK